MHLAYRPHFPIPRTAIVSFTALATLLLALALAMQPSREIIQYDQVDCQAVKRDLEKAADRASQRAQRGDLRDCLRSGYFRDEEIRHLF